MPGESALEQLRKITKVVSDTGDFDCTANRGINFVAISKYKPTDATTNPSLLLTAAKLPKYAHLVEDAVSYARKSSSVDKASEALDKLVIPGRVSTEVDARYKLGVCGFSISYDVGAMVEKATKLAGLYAAHGISKERVLIKVPSTWEGIKAAEILERDNQIHCNLTLLFSLVQAAACADANVTLISPFVGRILDWHKTNAGFNSAIPSEDPGVMSVKLVYNYLKKHGFQTTVMGASFRTKEEIVELAGIDLLTISPALLEELSGYTIHLEPKLSPKMAKESKVERLNIDEETFKKSLASDRMTSELLRDGIRKFDDDGKKMKEWLAAML